LEALWGQVGDKTICCRSATETGKVGAFHQISLPSKAPSGAIHTTS
jgi:hypothetical protein